MIELLHALLHLCISCTSSFDGLPLGLGVVGGAFGLAGGIAGMPTATSPDGTQTTGDAQGNVVQTFPNGTSVLTHGPAPAGDSNVIAPDGTRYGLHPDGSGQILAPGDTHVIDVGPTPPTP